MIVINVCDLVETADLLSPKKGDLLRKKISDLLKSNDEVCLDFKNYESLSSSFLNESIGKLIIENEWSPKKSKKMLSWKNLNEDDEVGIEIAIENAKTKLYLIKNKINQAEFYQQNIPAL